MENKKFLRCFIVTAISAALYSGAAMATTSDTVAGGTITFSGSVSDTTCNVTTNGGNDFTVNLNPISVSDVGTSAGVVTAGATPFTMAVSGCEGYSATNKTAQALTVTFSGSEVSDDEAYLKNSIGSASGIGISITKDGTTPIKLNSAIETGLTTTSSDGTNFDTGAEGNITYYANYYNYGGSSVSTGSVVTTVTYTFSYA
ncbi:fimbrial protein [Gibbsiella quercinecans]|uniref:fimbrial protein n=1 Tax=Gibbsiella quercinecans TaxID=929813 RepID=UPI003A4D6381